MRLLVGGALSPGALWPERVGERAGGRAGGSGVRGAGSGRAGGEGRAEPGGDRDGEGSAYLLAVAGMLRPPALALQPGARTPGPRGQVCGDLLQAGVPAGQRARCEGCLGVGEGGELGRSPLGSEALAVRCEGGDAPGTAGSCLGVRSQARPPPPCPTGPPARLCAGPRHPPGRPGPPDRAAGTLSMAGSSARMGGFAASWR